MAFGNVELAGAKAGEESKNVAEMVVARGFASVSAARCLAKGATSALLDVHHHMDYPLFLFFPFPNQSSSFKRYPVQSAISAHCKSLQHKSEWTTTW